ncbi:MAG: peptide ABC transporter substrate-binding protein [Alphaproteobacteria bacterium]|nr:peptide ABC transporter substrate-binding protein [Alphaproteobacteria bacterium]
MPRSLGRGSLAGLVLWLALHPASAQLSGGVLRLFHRDSTASASLHEEASSSAAIPFSAIFNNLIIFDQHEKQNRLDTIRPELADSWEWNADFTRLTFQLHRGVKWHDGKPFTSADVKCTWDMLAGRSPDKLRLNPRKTWYGNLDQVVTDGDYSVSFVMKRSQPAFPMLLASGFSPVYPCHVSAAEMRNHPIGTGPFKLVEYKRNESIKLAKNPDYWKPGRPYLDGIEWTIIPNRATQTLAFVAGQVDMTFPYEESPETIKDIHAQAPTAICETDPTVMGFNLLINRDKPPFDDPDIRRALMLTLDRKSFLDILSEGQGQIGGAMQSPPPGLWGLPPDILQTLPGYGPDVAANRAEARKLMEKHGYGPDKHLSLKVQSRNIALFRDPSVIMIDQLKQIYIDGELEVVETANWYPKISRKDYTIAGNITGNGADDPDAHLFENYACGSDRNYTNYCNPELDKMFEEQSMEPDQEKRKKLVWEIDKRLIVDAARPMIFRYTSGTCWYPRVHGITLMVNSIFNGWRFEDAWLE